MTIQDYSAKLFTWFLENDYYIEDKDLVKIIPISENKNVDREIDRAGMGLALESLEKQNLVRHIGKIWMLNQSLQAYNQNIELGASLCSVISKVINAYCEETKDDENKCDPTNIKPVDINKLIVIIDQLLVENNKESKSKV